MANKRGAASHREDCECRFCNSRKGKTEALAKPIGGIVADIPLTPEGVIDADSDLTFNQFASRERIARWMAFRQTEPNLTNKQIAEKMGLAPNTLQQSITRAVRAGWLRFDDPIQRMEHEIVPQVIDNLNHFLKARDKQVTIEAAKMTVGKMFAREQEVTDIPAQTMIAIKIEMPDPGATPRVMLGQIVGKPKVLDGQLEDSD